MDTTEVQVALYNLERAVNERYDVDEARLWWTQFGMMTGHRRRELALQVMRFAEGGND